MHVNPRAMHRLIKALVHNKPIAIPTHQTWNGARVYLVPIKSLARAEKPYKDYKKHGDGSRYNSASNVNGLRAAIRKGHTNQIPPIEIERISSTERARGKISFVNTPIEDHHHYVLWNGHHRVTAHQAEGKRFIRATFQGVPNYVDPRSSPKRSSRPPKGSWHSSDEER